MINALHRDARSRGRGFLALLCASVTISACGPFALYDKQYYTSATAPKYGTPSPNIIEFDDDGYLRDSTQLAHALAAMDSGAKHRRVLTLLFIHGWKNNAKRNNGNLNNFRSVASHIESDLNGSDSTTKRWTVVPIYIAWRGESAWKPGWSNLWLTWPWQQLTFWGRKATAERVGRGEFQVALSRISEKWRGWRTGGDPAKAYNVLVVTGHSFGGAALLSATVPWISSGLAGDKDAPGAADLVVALNPAIEAGILDKTVLSGDQPLAHDGAAITRLLVLDAHNDRARQILFPIGRTLGGLLRTSNSGKHWQAERVAAGRPPWQHSYNLVSRPAFAAPSEDGPVCNQYESGDEDHQFIELTRTSKVPCRNSVMVVRTTKGVIDGHSGIWDASTRDFLRRFVAEQQARIALRVQALYFAP